MGRYFGLFDAQYADQLRTASPLDPTDLDASLARLGPGRGLRARPKLTLSQTVGGSSAGGMDALLGRGTLAGLAANDEGDALERRQLELTLGYGFGVFGDRFTATPQAGLGLSDGHREYRLGWRVGLARSGPVSIELGLDATRREAANDDAEPVQALTLRGAVRW